MTRTTIPVNLCVLMTRLKQEVWLLVMEQRCVWYKVVSVLYHANYLPMAFNWHVQFVPSNKQTKTPAKQISSDLEFSWISKWSVWYSSLILHANAVLLEDPNGDLTDFVAARTLHFAHDVLSYIKSKSFHSPSTAKSKSLKCLIATALCNAFSSPVLFLYPISVNTLKH